MGRDLGRWDGTVLVLRFWGRFLWGGFVPFSFFFSSFFLRFGGCEWDCGVLI